MNAPGRAVSTLLELLGRERLRLADVGARDGLAERWLPLAPLIDARGFEPDQNECSRLNSIASSWPYHVEFLPTALGSSDGDPAQLHVCRQPGCSSVYVPNTRLCDQYAYGPNLHVVATQPLTLSRLDTLCAGIGFQPDVLKVDAQGSELDILKGSMALLPGILAIELEVEFVPQYVGQPLFSDIDIFLRSQGFSIRGLRRTYWRRRYDHGWSSTSSGGQLLHGDAFYVSDRLADRWGTLSTVDALKGLAVLAAYEQDDLVIDLLSAPHPALTAFAEAERRQLAADLANGKESLVWRLLAQVSGRWNHKQIRLHADRLRPHHATDWHDARFY